MDLERFFLIFHYYFWSKVLVMRYDFVFITIILLCVSSGKKAIGAENSHYKCFSALLGSSTERIDKDLDVPEVEFLTAERGDPELPEIQKQWVISQFFAIARLIPRDFQLAGDVIHILTGSAVSSDQYQGPTNIISVTHKTLEKKLEAVLRHEIAHYYFQRYFYTQDSEHKVSWNTFYRRLKSNEKPGGFLSTVSALRYFRISYLIRPYNELFADIVTAMSCQDGSCIARALAWPLLEKDSSNETFAKVFNDPHLKFIKLRDMAIGHGIDEIQKYASPEEVEFNLTKLDRHNHLAMARSLIYQAYVRSLGAQLGPETFIRILLKTIMEETHGRLGFGSFFKSTTEQARRANDELIRRFSANVEDYIRYNP